MCAQCDTRSRGLGAGLTGASICTEKRDRKAPADAGGSEGSARLNCAEGTCVLVQAGGAALRGAPAICYPALRNPDSWFAQGVVIEATVFVRTPPPPK